MSTIDDNDLILFHYRDGLPASRLAEIATALAASSALARRFAALGLLLGAADQDPAPAPDAQFEARLWQHVQPRIAAGFAPADDDVEADSASTSTSPPASATTTATAAPAIASAAASQAATAALPPTARSPVAHTARRPRRRLAIAGGTALAAALALAVVFPLGLFKPHRPHASTTPRVASRPAVEASVAASAWQSASDRILVAQLSQHLRRTRGVLQSVAHAESAALLPRDDAYLRALAQDNRLYAAAAERRGIRALAGFLRSLDPVLVELAQRSTVADAAHDEDMRRFVRDGDLLFRLHAAHARLLARGDLRA